jgi:two-component system sensor histidine kinase KdpD
VVDRGPGIDAGELERVFEPFYRAGAGGGRRDGSGLGLAIARGFTEANAGFLYAESLPGQGATFVFELPLSEAVDERLEGPAQAPADPGEVTGARAGSRADTLAAGSPPPGSSTEAAGG